jgi:hypothetical protein
LVAGVDARLIAEFVERAHAGMVHRGGMPLAAVLELVGVCRRVAAIENLGSECGTEDRLACAPNEYWSTSSVARASGIGVRAVRKRAERGRYPGARRVDARWWIPIEEAFL